MSVLSRIKKFNAGRSRSLLKIKFARMSVSPFTFFRGTNHLFVDAWHKLSPPDPGPSILICGDLHVENFGAFRTESGSWCFGINDFDDASIAPCGLDVVRCASSIFLAAVDWKLTPIAAANLVLVFLDEYRTAIAESQGSTPSGQIEAGAGRDLISRALGSSKVANRKRMIEMLTNQSRNKIRRDPQKRPSLPKKCQATIKGDVEKYLKPKGFHVLDVTGRIAGIGSLGNDRFVSLIASQLKHDERMLDIKLAVKSPLSIFQNVSQPDFFKTEAERVVVAQRQLQGENAVGLDITTFQSRPFRVREMVPDEDRCQIDRFRKKVDKLKHALKIIGRVVAWSHLRGAEFSSLKNRPHLENWASGANLDAVLKSSVRYAQQTTEDFQSFKESYRPKSKVDPVA